MAPESIFIRQAALGDAETLIEFNRGMALETENRRLDPVRLRKGIFALLERTSYGFYILAEQPEANGRKPVGQLMITYEWSDWRNGVFWWIQSVYVLPDRRRQGIFRALYDHVLLKARAEPQVCGIRLYVERENHTAQIVYQRMGLCRSGYIVYENDFVLSGRGPSPNR